MKLSKMIVKIASALIWSTRSSRAFSVLASKAGSVTTAATTITSNSICSSISSGPRTVTSRAMSSTSTAEPLVPSETETTTNPLLQQDGLPKFASIDPSHVTPAVEALLAQLEADLVQLEEELELTTTKSIPSYEQVVPAVERMQFPLGYAWGVTGHLNGVKNGDALRQAYEANQPSIVKAFSKFSQSKPLFDALSAIAADATTSNDDAGDDDFAAKQRRRAVENSLRAMKLGGVGLAGADKERFNESKWIIIAKRFGKITCRGRSH